MHERLKQIRSESGLSVRSFGERIGVAASLVTHMEKGDRTIAERTIRSICAEFNVRREWLETGEGDMYEPKTDAEEAEAALRSVGAEHDPVLRALVSTWLRLPEEDQLALNRIAKTFSERLRDAEARGETVTLLDTLLELQPKREPTIEEKVDLYRRQLELEARVEERSSSSDESEMG